MLNKLIDKFKGSKSPPIIYIFEPRKTYTRKHVLFLGDRTSSNSYDDVNACGLDGAPFQFQKIAPCISEAREFGVPNKSIVTMLYEQGSERKAINALEKYKLNKCVQFIHVERDKNTKSVCLKIDKETGKITFRRKDEHIDEILDVIYIIGADGRKSTVHDCIPENKFITCKTECKIDQSAAGRRFGNVYIFRKQQGVTFNDTGIYAPKFSRQSSRIRGIQNRYRIFNTSQDFFYLAFQWYEDEVEQNPTGSTYKYRLRYEYREKIVKYIKFLTNINVDQSFSRVIDDNMKKVFEIQTGYYKNLLYRNENQNKYYLLIGDAAVHVDFFSGHGLENASVTVDAFVSALSQKFEISWNMQTQQKIQTYNCLKHLSSILRTCPTYNSEEEFQTKLMDSYGVTSDQYQELENSLGYDELKILFNPSHETYYVDTRFTHKSLKKKCQDKKP